MSTESSKRNVFSNSAHSDHSISVLIDRICDEFEQSWKLGRPTTIEQQLRKVSPGDRSALFRELLEIEIEIRSARNDEFNVGEYLDRFPQEAELTDLIFRKIVRRKKLGDYELLDEIGHGGMGIVYRGRQVFLDQTVAVKVLSQHYHSDAHVVSRFRREMRMIGGLHHPNIVQALNAGESGGTLYLVMEFVDGYSLHQLVKKTGNSPPKREDSEDWSDNHVLGKAEKTGEVSTDRWASNPSLATLSPPSFSFPLGAAAEVIRQAAFGLEHAFEQGLVHRDIKPANLMVTKNGIVKILDLGLGKFRAENRFTESREAALTQFGATMGTVDYMAPEQWENATGVDIRADIYSLGCTLFFMLTGRAPFDTEGPGSQRKKLLAHLEGDIPNIEDIRSDCPLEFAEIVRKMVAKEPEERFQTPKELFQAIAPFANLDELKSVIATVPVSFESSTESTPAYRTSNEDTIHGQNWTGSRTQRQSFGSRTDYPASLEYLVQTERFRSTANSFWYSYKPGLLALLCALISFFIFRGFNDSATAPLSIVPPEGSISTARNPHEGQTEQITPNPGSDITDKPNGSHAQRPGNTTENNSPANPSVPTFNEVLCDLVELPGLGGQWWFVEMPWFLPFVRENLPEVLLQDNSDVFSISRQMLKNETETPWLPTLTLPYLDPNVGKAQESLWILSGYVSKDFPDHKKKLLEGLYQSFDKRLEKEEMVNVFRNLLSGYETSLALLPKEEQTASDFHTIALLMHRISQQSSDQTLVPKAKDAYKTAIEKYTQQAIEADAAPDAVRAKTLRQLQLVCLSDAARLSFWADADNDIGAFANEATRILTLKDVDKSDLFKIEFYTTFGDYCSAASKNNDQLFEMATDVLNQSRIAATDHPLRAYISERLAWSLIDQCKFKEAEEQFSNSLRFRKNNLDRSNNPFAAIYVYHNQHGLAITKRYLGDIEGAKIQFEDVVNKVETALKRTDFNGSVQQRYFSSMNERLSNSLERYGDCTLYGGAASFGTRFSRVSASDMKQTAELYERSRTAAVSKAVWYVMSSKLAIIKSMSGTPEETKTILDELTKEAPKIVFGSDQRRATMMRDVAGFVYQLKLSEQEKNQEKIAESLSALRRFLLQFDSESSNELRYRREPLEIQLFCAELLIASKLEVGNIIAAREEVPSLEPLLLTFAPLESTRPFFHRYYDLAIQCFAESEQDKADPASRERAILNQLKFIRQSRFWRPTVSPEGETATAEDPGTFFFYFSAQGGIAIFAPTDRGKSPERFLIPFTRQEVKDAASSGKKLALPVDLAIRINDERTAERPTRISFSDLPCWHRKSDALQDADWPFDVPFAGR